jgi:hypothetical protein
MIRPACKCDSEGPLESCDLESCTLDVTFDCSPAMAPAAYEVTFTGHYRAAMMNGVLVPLAQMPNGTSRGFLCQEMLGAIGPLESAEVRLMN